MKVEKLTGLKMDDTGVGKLEVSKTKDTRTNVNQLIEIAFSEDDD
jgi:hypothetical protein